MRTVQQAAEVFARALPHLTPDEVPVRLAEVMGALVAREVHREKERCAKVCEGRARQHEANSVGGGGDRELAAQLFEAQACAEAIRSGTNAGGES